MKVKWRWIAKYIWYPWLIWSAFLLLIALVLAPLLRSVMENAVDFPLQQSFLVYGSFLLLNVIRICFEYRSCKKKGGSEARGKLWHYGLLNGIAYMAYQLLGFLLWSLFRVPLFAPLTALNRPFQMLLGGEWLGVFVNILGYGILSTLLYWGLSRRLQTRRYR